MTFFSEKFGDLFDSSAPALAHGVNTEGLMGAGIAVEFRRRWPDMYKQYKRICVGPIEVDRKIAGWPSITHIPQLTPGHTMEWMTSSRDRPYWILNLATQDKPGRHARLDWLESSLVEVLTFAEKTLTINRIAMPRIGCGIGGLYWEDVREILEYYARKTSIDIEVWSPPDRL